MNEDTKKKLREAGRKDLIETHDIVQSGYAGILPENGMIVDRRKHPNAIPIPENKLFNTPKPEDLTQVRRLSKEEKQDLKNDAMFCLTKLLPPEDYGENEDCETIQYALTELADDGMTEEEITDWNVSVVSNFMHHCHDEGLDIPDSMFESFFDA